MGYTTFEIFQVTDHFIAPEYCLCSVWGTPKYKIQPLLSFPEPLLLNESIHNAVAMTGELRIMEEGPTSEKHQQLQLDPCFLVIWPLGTFN